ncbi:hypothetical protein EFD55_01205 [Rhizobium pisi]|uniref:Uncharacterized protein n=2 Tax=Rhizobium TaxID=379 RepID=A0ABY0BAG0_9HYPH|nr:hypothetical protein EFD55_01205 [Rhizobium pisi]RUM13062.1 hypothetical protein EFB14_12225 [Rhizobium fabae]
MILFFIYNKHFQVNGNIDPVDEGGNEPQAARNELRVIWTGPWSGAFLLLSGNGGRGTRAEKRGSDGKAEHGLQGGI